MAQYRVEYTEMKPGGALERQCDLVYGTLENVRDYFDRITVHAASPVVVIEHTQSDSFGRAVPATEWDTCDDW